MSKAKISIAYLLDQPDNISFITNTYKSLLSRSLSFTELGEALLLLTSGMSKKAFLYWIVSSAEFNNRNQVSDLNCYKLEYYHYKFNKLKTIFFKTPPAATDNRQTVTPSLFKQYKYSSFDIEYSALDLCQIAMVPTLLSLPDLVASEYTTIGSLASDLLLSIPDINNKNINTLDKISELGPTDICFLTDPVSIYNLFEDNYLPSIHRIIKNKLIFTMPTYKWNVNQISVIWNGNWTEPSKLFGADCRWFYGKSEQSEIIIFNNRNEYRKITINFDITSFEDFAELFIKFQDIEKKYSLTTISQHIEFDLYLSPNYNSINLFYIGKGLILDDSLKHYKFAVSNLKIVENTDTFTGIELYTLDSENLGEMFHPYVLADSYIRNRLHKNGFFEINSYHISKSRSIYQLDTTRYHHLNNLLGNEYYYTYSPGNIEVKHGVIVYIANRSTFSNKTEL